MTAIFSPDEKFVVAGAGTPPSGGKSAGGKLVFLKREGLTLADELEMPSCVVRVQWHSKINQVCQLLYIFNTILTPIDLYNACRWLFAYSLFPTYIE